MNLQQLESPLPKPWLNIQCHTLTADEVITPVQPSNLKLWSAHQVGALPVGPNTTVGNLCSVTDIENPNYNGVTNVYTAPIDQYVNVSFQGLVQVNPSGNVLSSVEFFINNIPVQGTAHIVQATVANPSVFNLQSNALVKMTAGQTLRYEVFAQTGGPGAWSVLNSSFFGSVV